MQSAAAPAVEEWSEGRTRRWLGDLGLQTEDLAQAETAFEAEEVDGYLLRGFLGKRKRLVRCLERGSGLDPAGVERVATAITQGVGSLLSDNSEDAPSAGAGAIQEGHPERWTEERLKTVTPERCVGLQREIDRWLPDRWALEDPELGHGSGDTTYPIVYGIAESPRLDSFAR